ncbi:MAG: hypothetical protein COB17_08140 [Sulfurimonas sp.]|nr:MAG: hypothetical protein COB17_08140 [Sulfurimonas sp.]
MKTLRYEKLTIYEVSSFAKELTDYLSDAKDRLELDLSSVQKIDIAVIQLLLSTSKSCTKRNIIFSIYGLNETNKEILHLCGCDLLLGDEL